MVWGLVITCAILFSCGIGFLLAERLKLPSRAASRAMHSMGRNRKDKPNPLTLLMRELSGRLAGRLRLNDYRRAQLEADLRTGDMTQTPEQFVAENIVRAGTVAVLAIPVAFLSKFLAVLLLVAAILLYRLGSMALRKKSGQGGRGLNWNCRDSWRISKRPCRTAGMSLPCSKVTAWELEKNSGGNWTSRSRICEAEMTKRH